MAQPKIPVVDFKQVDDDIFFNTITGDFELAVSDNQHVSDILKSFPGYWKSSLPTGAALQILLKGRGNPVAVENTIKTQLEADNYQVTRPSITVDANGKATIKPYAIRL